LILVLEELLEWIPFVSHPVYENPLRPLPSPEFSPVEKANCVSEFSTRQKTVCNRWKSRIAWHPSNRTNPLPPRDVDAGDNSEGNFFLHQIFIQFLINYLRKCHYPSYEASLMTRTWVTRPPETYKCAQSRNCRRNRRRRAAAAAVESAHGGCAGGMRGGGGGGGDSDGGGGGGDGGGGDCVRRRRRSRQRLRAAAATAGAAAAVAAASAAAAAAAAAAAGEARRRAGRGDGRGAATGGARGGGAHEAEYFSSTSLTRCSKQLDSSPRPVGNCSAESSHS
jgi:hypothetical protein